MSKTIISVIIPTIKQSVLLDSIRSLLQSSTVQIEVILVAYHSLKNKMMKNYPNEQIIFTQNKGRGFALYEGYKYARGEIVLFLHDDTLLPVYWDSSIINLLSNPTTVGGAFSLQFNRHNRWLHNLLKLADLWYKLTGEFWGDRAIFIRSKLLANHTDILNVPIMEDVRLSRFMKSKGKTIILSSSVITDAKAFVQKGYLKHTFDIFLCRLLYILHFSPKAIYRLYYN